jgi:Fur family ferric uptake transcriptional regulator
MRMTSQREIILEELRKLKSHPTADELYLVVRKRLPRISIATVYRNLEMMSEAGIIKKLEYSGRQKRFDATIQPHNHIHCIRCGRISDIQTIPGSELRSMISDSCGFEIIDDQVEFSGICPECQDVKKINQNTYS